MRFSAVGRGVLPAAIMLLTACNPAQTEEQEQAVLSVPEPIESGAGGDDEYIPAAEVDDIPIERIGFEPGSNTTVVEDSITGYATVDYVVKVAAGEPLAVSMETDNTSAYFNVIAPGETNVAFHVGSTAGNAFSGVAETSGDYRVRVYMMRSAARRDETAPYTLEISVGSD